MKSYEMSTIRDEVIGQSTSRKADGVFATQSGISRWNKRFECDPSVPSRKKRVSLRQMQMIG